MKKMKLMSILFLTVILMVACGKDKDTPAPDPITVIVCQDSRYTGPNCDQQIMPKKISITKVAVTSFPEYKIAPNTTWDVMTNNVPGSVRAELKVELYTGFPAPTSYEFGTSAISDAYHNQRHEFTQSLSQYFPIEIGSPSASHTLRLNDVDVGSSDIIQDLVFTPYHSTNGFPAILYLNNGSTNVEVHLRYDF